MKHSPDSSARRMLRGGLLACAMTVLATSLGGWASVATAQTARSAAASHASTAFWRDSTVSALRASATGEQPAIRVTRSRALSLDRASIGAALAQAPMERSNAARFSPLVLSLPDPAGGFQRFSVVESPIMEPGLAAKHPQIKTYAGRGIDDPTATLRMDISQLGLRASVRSQKGGWYIDPLYNLDDSVYVSYLRRDALDTRPAFAEPFLFEPQLSVERGQYRAADSVVVRGAGFAPGQQVTITVRNPAVDASPRQTLFATADRDGTVEARFTAEPYKAVGSYEVQAAAARGAPVTTSYRVVPDDVTVNASVGNQLRTYRLALVTDPAYATYFGGPANVTAAKVALINRVTQIYEDETSIRLVLIANNDLLNLNTAAEFSGANGPCGAAGCYTGAVAACGSALDRTRNVVGLIIGASNYDIGHIAGGSGSGGVAGLGVVGGDQKARGCTALSTPIGDVFAVDYVAHEMGHQFAGNHTFNGTAGSCSGGNRNAANSVEPGSGSSIMAYAGICGATDNLQPHSDAYWSQRSFDEIVAYTSSPEGTLGELQVGALRNFITNGQEFVLRFGGNDSVAIVRGANYTAAGIQAAIQGIAGWPAGGTVTVSGVTDTGFSMTFGGTLTNVNVPPLQLVSCTGGCSGLVGEITAGGPTARGGTVTAVANSAPVVTTPASFTIPLRTPFALTGSATDPDGDTVTYLWEQNDRGAATGTNLVNNTKTNGPLFRQFGVLANVTTPNSLLYNSPGQNIVTTNPTRVFPDLPQILAGNTNAETGSCVAGNIDCFSEFLPTASYVGFGANASPLSLNFKLTARDGRGGVNSSATQLLLATGAGPFLVTSPNTAVTLDGTTSQTVTWNVANTNVAPVNTANVKISLSTDGGLTYPVTLAASTPNTGSRAVVLPNVNSTTARIKVEAVGNVYFDVSNANFTIRLTGDLNTDGSVTCADVAIVRASLGKSTGQPGFNPVADVNNDGIVNIRDLAYVTQRLPAGTSCP